MNPIKYLFLLSVAANIVFAQYDHKLKINEQGYYEMQGLNIMMFDDFYPEGHQGGLTIIQHGCRVAANGDVRLEPSPGQWSPVPAVGEKKIDKEQGTISVSLWYPDTSKDRKGFNPVIYSDLVLKYTIRTELAGENVRLIVDLDQPLPAEWANKVGFNLELFPGAYFGEPYLMDNTSGIFPRQANGPMTFDDDSSLQIIPLAIGKELTLCPGIEGKEIKITSKQQLELLDGRGLHNNSWFVLRSVMQAGAKENAVEWIIIPKVNTSWMYKPVIQISQVGYHPDQKKFAVVELDKLTKNIEPLRLIKIYKDHKTTVKEISNPAAWGDFLRYKYIRFDFSEIKDTGIYQVEYGPALSNYFEIKKDIYTRHVWNPVIEYYLPVQMCHMRIEDRYKVWHGLCHIDDALMAPINHNHFDGYIQFGSTLTEYESGEHVPGLNIGGWHDAGDYDLRVESQAETIYRLSQAYQLFKVDYDQTTISQETRIAVLHKPDGKPDILQQIEHGALSIIGGYKSMGRLYRGIICPTLKQYVHLGDAATMSDNIIYSEGKTDPVMNKALPNDDRWVFTEENPRRELYVAQVLAAVYRSLKDFNPELAQDCINAASELYLINTKAEPQLRLSAAAELYLSTSSDEYKKYLIENSDIFAAGVLEASEYIGDLTIKINDNNFREKIEKAVKESFEKISEQQKDNPYGVPYKPYIWGAGWGIQAFGVRQLFLHIYFPELFSSEYIFNALNFILGCHPGENNASFASGVGVNSLLVAYGVNRDEWSYIPGGVGSGTALIRPDFPELKIWPYFWQQTEYVMGGGGTDFLLLSLAADHLLNLNN